MYSIIELIKTVTDPEFPRWGGSVNPKSGSFNLLPIFLENIMKMKEISPGAVPGRAPIGSVNGKTESTHCVRKM